MKKLKIEKESREVYDIEHVTKPVVLLKGIGRYCDVCKKHLFGRKDKTTCSNKCRKIKYRQTTKQQNNNSLQARISVEKTEGLIAYRIVSLYLKKGVIHQVKITAESKELWLALDQIASYRKVVITP